MNTSPLISVLMPIHNGNLEHIKLAIFSILKQTFFNFELIIIDDASDRETRELLNQMKKKDFRIVLLRNERNLGITTSLNKGIEHSRADFIARHDADDIAHQTRLQIQFEFLVENKGVAAVFTGRNNVDNRGKIIDQFPVSEDSNILCAELLFNCRLCHPTVLMRKAALLSVGGYDTNYRYAQDYDLWTRLCLKYKISGINKVLLDYRIAGSSVTNTKRQEQLLIAEEISYRYFIEYYHRYFIEYNQQDLSKISPSFREAYCEFWNFIQTRGVTNISFGSLIKLRPMWKAISQDDLARDIWKGEFLWVSRKAMFEKKSLSAFYAYIIVMFVI